MLQFNLFKARKPAGKKILVLMYHRIADLHRDPWELAVSPPHFEQQLALLTSKFNVISVPQLVEQLANKSITSDSVCLTFDDAYSDNYEIARPLLEKYDCPGTFFATSRNLADQQPFWWDELEALVLDEQKLPPTFSETIGIRSISVTLGDECVLTELLRKKQNSWTWPGKPPTKRTVLYLELWEALKSLPFESLQNELSKIKTWAAIDKVSNLLPRPMTTQHLQQMSKNPLFHIGIHTVSHPALSCHSFDMQLKEIVENKQFLENVCNRPINTIAFPYGDYNIQTLQIAQQIGLKACFSTKEFSVRNESNAIDLGRLKVNNWNGSMFEKRLSSWYKNA